MYVQQRLMAGKDELKIYSDKINYSYPPLSSKFFRSSFEVVIFLSKIGRRDTSR